MGMANRTDQRGGYHRANPRDGHQTLAGGVLVGQLFNLFVGLFRQPPDTKILQHCPLIYLPARSTDDRRGELYSLKFLLFSRAYGAGLTGSYNYGELRPRAP